MPDFSLGMNAAIYYGTTGAAIGAMTELTNVRDVTVNLDASEADYTTRANAGWRATAATLKTASVDFEMVWQESDAGFAAIKAAFLASGTLEMAILDKDSGESGAQGPKGAFSIMTMNRVESLEGVITANITAKLASFTEWLTI